MPRPLHCPAYKEVEEGEGHLAYDGAVSAPILLHKIPYPIPDKSDTQFPSAAAAIVDIPSVTPRVVSMYSPCSVHTVEEEEPIHTHTMHMYIPVHRQEEEEEEKEEVKMRLIWQLSWRKGILEDAYTYTQTHTNQPHTNLQQ